MSGKDSTYGSGQNNNVVSYDYGNKKADSCKVPKFNGDPEEFSWWKTNFYNSNFLTSTTFESQFVYLALEIKFASMRSFTTFSVASAFIGDCF